MTLFKRIKQSIFELTKNFYTFSSFTGLRANFTKCVIVGMGFLKLVKIAVYDMNYVDSTSDTFKILGVHFFYNKTFQNEMNF